MSKELKNVALNDIEIGDIALRGAELENEQFKGLMASIKLNGVLESIVIQPSPETPGKYRLIDGLQRVTIMNLLGKEEIPAMVIDADEAQVMKVQIQMNLHRVNTKPAAYGKQIRRWMALDTTLTVTTIAEELGVSVQWVTQRINLHTLLKEIADRVDSGEICATNAFALAKLPADEQKEWVKRAITQSPDLFVEQCLARAKEIKDAARSGKKAGDETFVSVKRLRGVKDVKDELDLHTARALLVMPDMSGLDGFDAAIAWVLHQDLPTVTAEKEKWEVEKKAREEKAAKKAEEREAKRLEAEAKKAAKAEAAEAEVKATREAITQE
jgi:ParB/RepB/Spo0J family partition protein